MNRPTRVALITGGGTGIGAAIARHLSASGHAVAIAGRRMEALEEVRTQIERSGGDALPILADLEVPGAPARLVEEVLGRWRRLDVVVNNAAVLRYGVLAETPIDVFDQHVAVNVRAPFLLTQAALEPLRKSDAGAVLNISSASANLSIPGQAVYGMTKAALEYLTRMWASEFAHWGIRVNCLAPGPVDTPIHLAWAPNAASARKALSKATPLGRVASPEDIARWAVFLCDPDQSFVTGAVVAVDGGQTLNGWGSTWREPK